MAFPFAIVLLLKNAAGVPPLRPVVAGQFVFTGPAWLGSQFGTKNGFRQLEQIVGPEVDPEGL
jgi:hypothetical protein